MLMVHPEGEIVRDVWYTFPATIGGEFPQLSAIGKALDNRFPDLGGIYIG